MPPRRKSGGAAPAPQSAVPAMRGEKGYSRLVSSLVDDVSLKGVGVYMADALPEVRTISTGAPSLDAAIGVGGWPLRYTSIVHGGEGTAKTTLALEAARECQAIGGLVVYVDCERKLVGAYAEGLGVNTSEMIIVRPPHIERGFMTLDKLANKFRANAANSDVPMLIVWDSLHAAKSLRQEKAGYEKESWSPESKAYSSVFRLFAQVVSEGNIAFLCVSQVRMTSGAHTGAPAQERVGVGKAPLFYASLIVHVKPRQARTMKKSSKTGETFANGRWIEAQCRKNQLDVPYRSAWFPLVYGHGVDKAASAICAAEAFGIAIPQKKARWTLALDGEEYDVPPLKAVNAYFQKYPSLLDRLIEVLREQSRATPLPSGKVREVTNLDAPDEEDDEEEGDDGEEAEEKERREAYGDTSEEEVVEED